MPNSSSPAQRRHAVFRVAVFFLIGLCTGFAWFAALFPVGVTGAVGYDLSRYGFALGVATALVGMLFRPWRAYGLGVFFVGLALAITWRIAETPIRVQPPGRLFISIVVLGTPLAITSLFGMGCFLACVRAEHNTMRMVGEAKRLAAAPRRFGMGTLMVVVLAVSSLFAAANWLALPPPVSIFIGGFLGIIGAFQVLMQKVPRAASVGVGAVLLPLTLAVTWSTVSGNLGPALAPLMVTPADVIFVGAHFAAVGAVFGYVGGVLVAGLFLVIDRAGRPLRHRHVVEPNA